MSQHTGYANYSMATTVHQIKWGTASTHPVQYMPLKHVRTHCAVLDSILHHGGGIAICWCTICAVNSWQIASGHSIGVGVQALSAA